MLQRGALHKVLLQSIWTRLRDTSFDKDDARLLASAGLMMVEHYKPPSTDAA
jgi:hypothetical protein